MTISEPTSPPEAISMNNNNNDDDGGVNTIVSTIQVRFQQMKVSSSSAAAEAEAPEAEDDSAAAVLSLYKDYQRILSVGEECINPNELLDLLIRQGRGSVKRSSISTTTSATNTTTEAALVNTDDDDVDDTERALGFQLYDGFEPSGRMHIAQGIFKVHNVNKCTYQNNGGTFIFWIADWFALMKYVFINGVVL